MFSESNIQGMVDRLGWSDNEKSEYSTKLSASNMTKNSGLTLNNYHKLVTVENVYHCMPHIGIDDDGLNTYLSEVLDNVCRDILTEVFVLDSRAEVQNDYSGTIDESIGSGVFDNCIGYCHSVKILELLISTVRSNHIETIAGQNYAQLMSELKGFSTKEGVLVSKGLLSYCEEHRTLIKDKMFGYSGVSVADATQCW